MHASHSSSSFPRSRSSMATSRAAARSEDRPRAAGAAASMDSGRCDTARAHMRRHCRARDVDARPRGGVVIRT
jgi:hypothetical protein